MNKNYILLWVEKQPIHIVQKRSLIQKILILTMRTTTMKVVYKA
jgi:hypothetical protein